MFKKIISVLAAAALALTCTACSGNSGTSSSAGSAAGIAKESIKVGVIHIGDPADGSGYSYTHDVGIQGMQKKLGLDDSQIVRKINVSDSDTAASKSAMEACIAEGCNIIFATSYGYMDTVEALANEYPDVYFSHATGYKSNDKNFNNYFGRIYQARFLAGIAAGLKTASGKIGYVAAYGTELAETCSGINAFALGVQSVNPDAKVYVKTLNSWFDPANETAYAEALIADGCDVIAQHCDTANPQVAAESHGVFGCGYNSDMTAQAPKAHLTAPVFNWDVYYTAAVQAVIDGKWSEFGNYYEGLNVGFVDVSPVSANCEENTQKYIDAAKALMASGEWDVFTNVAISFDADGNVIKTDRQLTDNAGNAVPEVTDEVIKGSMNYFVQGVELG
ncbi:MAG: BMP family ABC transporter substrate-binding protein [Oscillospiraceae bacterium]